MTEKAGQPSKFSVFNVQANRKIHKEFVAQREQDKLYIAELEKVLKEHGLELPKLKEIICAVTGSTPDRIMKDGSLDALKHSLNRIQDHNKMHEVCVQFRDLTFWNMVPKKKIPTVGSAVKGFFMGSGPKQRVNIIKDLTGRILPRTMTLLMGPPGCGKSTLLKALATQLQVGSAHLEGEILYNGDPVDSGNYLVGKVASYTDEKDQHAATLTVRETLEFAWEMTTGGHHSYNIAKDEATARVLDGDDKEKVKVNNVLKVLGLNEVANSIVGDASLRGVSGGQKRRVTLGEMLMPPRSIRYMDAISNGLDAATTFDIIQALKYVTQAVGLTTVVSLLQPAPEVFYSFEDVIVMADGQIIYHGATLKVLEYFKSLGYSCPDIMDVADFLQMIPTADGRRFTLGNTTASGGIPPVGTDALVQAWKASEMYHAMVEEMDEQVKKSTGKWPAVYLERFPKGLWYSFKHSLFRQFKIMSRDVPFIKGRIMQSLIVGAIAGSLFSNLATEDSNTMSGILYFCAIFGALSGMAMLPLIFSQRAVFYKQSRALFFPTPAFVLSQTLVMVPLQIFETIVFSTIIYWSVGMSDSENGGRFFTFMLCNFLFSLCISQFYRMVASCVASPAIAQTLSGVALILMILFCGYIIPKSNIPPGWEWFYWINPINYVLRAVLVNEFMAPDYDFLVCADETCTAMERFGDQVLKSRGNPTEMVWVWYSVAILVGLFGLFLVLSGLALNYIRTEPVPPPPITVDYSDTGDDPSYGKVEGEEQVMIDIPFEPATFAFQNIWYTVKVGKRNEELDLLKGVSGYFEPGTLTALMGSSGAGKTTLLDVLSGRKNTGETKGNIFVNGKPVDVKTFRRTMGYVEQFDSLAPHDTAREAVEFSAALRLPRETTYEQRAQWVTTVLTMLELLPLEHTMVGSVEAGGMSFEQKKRVSIAVELAANPAILFLDEPTTGLDSRSAQIVIRCIKRVAASGRSIVCTIHQPSAVIFDSFDSLLLLRRGGQTVFFGELGENSQNLVSYMQGIPGVAPKPTGSNPATWMLEVIGAGTSNSSESMIDHHAYYNQSVLSATNTAHIDILCPPHKPFDDEADDIETGGAHQITTAEVTTSTDCAFVPVFFGEGVAVHPDSEKIEQGVMYNATYTTQFRLLMYRFLLAYWRSPTYNFVRMVVSVVIALIFSSTYADQKYSSDVDVISRVALIYITCLFMGVVNMKSVQPVVLDERPAFYREQFSKLYDVKLYVLASTLVEVPYLIVSSVFFVIPFFFIVGFDKDGTAQKFFWYWLFQALYMSVMVFMGHLLSCALPGAPAANVIGGMISTMISLFAGFLIRTQNFPTFWTFMYWLDPLHYAVEGIMVTQFNQDHTPITVVSSGASMTAESFVKSFYQDWSYSHRLYDMMALLLFIAGMRVATYLSLEYMRHDKR